MKAFKWYQKAADNGHSKASREKIDVEQKKTIQEGNAQWAETRKNGLEVLKSRGLNATDKVLDASASNENKKKFQKNPPRPILNASDSDDEINNDQ